MKQPDFQHPQPQSQQPAYGQVFTYTPDISDLITQIQDLQRQINDMKAKRINLNTDLIGLFETVKVAPTLKPTSPYEQIKISLIGGTYAFNIYDGVNNVWKKVTIT